MTTNRTARLGPYLVEVHVDPAIAPGCIVVRDEATAERVTRYLSSAWAPVTVVEPTETKQAAFEAGQGTVISRAGVLKKKRRVLKAKKKHTRIFAPGRPDHYGVPPTLVRERLKAFVAANPAVKEDQNFRAVRLTYLSPPRSIAAVAAALHVSRQDAKRAIHAGLVGLGFTPNPRIIGAAAAKVAAKKAREGK